MYTTNHTYTAPPLHTHTHTGPMPWPLMEFLFRCRQGLTWGQQRARLPAHLEAQRTHRGSLSPTINSTERQPHAPSGPQTSHSQVNPSRNIQPEILPLSRWCTCISPSGPWAASSTWTTPPQAHFPPTSPCLQPTPQLALASGEEWIWKLMTLGRSLSYSEPPFPFTQNGKETKNVVE